MKLRSYTFWNDFCVSYQKRRFMANGYGNKEGEPFISVVPVEPGLTNIEKEENGQRIVGMNTESAEINEGLVRFDIIFYVRMEDGISQVIVNIEAQKDEPSSYQATIF